MDMELLQRLLPCLGAWAASRGHVGLELAVASCWGAKALCHMSHRETKHTVFILPAHHGDAVFQVRALHRQQGGKLPCFAVGGIWRIKYPLPSHQAWPCRPPATSHLEAGESQKLLKTWIRRAAGAWDTSDHPPQCRNLIEIH